MVTICTTTFNIKKFYVTPTLWIFVFCMDPRTKGEYFAIQYYLTGFCNWECLLRGKNWIFGQVLKIVKSIISFVMSVRPSAWNTASTGRIFMKFDIWAFFENLLRKFKFH